MLPAWTKRAACAELAPNRAPWGDAFDDDLAYKADPTEYEWPAGVLRAMKVCSTCPVRPECLDYAYAMEAHVDKAYWAAETTSKEDRRRYGVYAGIPGRIREHYPDPQDAATWSAGYAVERGWTLERKGKMTA